MLNNADPAGGTALEAQLRIAKRNVLILTMAQAILGAAPPISFAVGGLVGYQMLGSDKSLATAPLTGFNIGVAFGAMLIAFMAQRVGRRASFMLGAALAAVGSALAAIALFRQDFWMFAAALLVIGVSSGFSQKIRFAAADASPSFFKARAISWILAGGIVSAVLGSQIAIWAKDLLSPVTFAGCFVALVPICLVALAIFSRLDLPPVDSRKHASTTRRPLRDIILTQRFLTGMFCGISTYALMTFMMTGAPLAMVIGCGFSSDMATLGIQWHVLAMYAPSFFTGMLIARIGTERIVAIGLVILMACAVVAHAGIALWNFWGALILLGVGWNFAFIGATSIVASSYAPDEADRVQGFHDIVLFGSVAVASFSSGKVFNAFGWDAMNLIIWPITGVCLVLVLLLLRTSSRKVRA